MPVHDVALPMDELARLARRRAPLAGVGHVALEWFGIAVAATVATHFDQAWLWAAAVVFVGARQHALAALAHEAAHGRLAPGRWNAIVGEACVAWPLGLSLRGYRPVHMAHHRALSTPDDPDWARNRPDRWGEPGRPLAKLRHLLGLERRQAGLAYLFTGGNGGGSSDRAWRTARLVYVSVALAAVVALDAWRTVGLCWLLPLVAVFLPLMRLRGIAEHWAVAGTSDLDRTRTLLLSPAGRTLFLPKHMGYHLEHHLYPQVPFQALPAVHAALMRGGIYRERAHVTRGFVRFLREVAAFPALGAAQRRAGKRRATKRTNERKPTSL